MIEQRGEMIEKVIIPRELLERVFNILANLQGITPAQYNALLAEVNQAAQEYKDGEKDATSETD